MRVDNKGPQGPVLPDHRPLIEFTQGGETLGCCAQVTKDKGPIEVHIEGTDANFSSLSVVAYGGCSGSIGIFSKTYNGDRTDLGAPSPGITVSWDPVGGRSRGVLLRGVRAPVRPRDLQQLLERRSHLRELALDHDRVSRAPAERLVTGACRR